MTPTFTIYCASSSTLAPVYIEAASHLAATAARAGIDIVTGGGYSGLMGAVADAALAAGGRVTGIIPQFMEERGWHHRGLTDMKIVDGMHTRKRTMAEMATAAIALPGGVGTFEELMEIITWRQLGLFRGNVVIYNVNNYYGPLLSMFDTAIEQGFMRPDHRSLFTVAESVDEVIESSSRRTCRPRLVGQILSRLHPMPAVSDSLHLTGPQPAPQAAADSVATDSMVFNTVIVDSIGADTVHGRIPHFIPVDKADSLRVEAYADSLEAYSALPEVPQGSREGVAPLRRGTSLTHDSGLTLLMAAMLIMTGINTPSVVKALKSYRHELWSVRRRPNVFDDERTVSHRAATLLALVFIVFGGSALYFLPGLPPSPSFWGAAASMTLTGLYYLFQYTAYSLVGYAFASPDGRRQWLSGFNATQAYSGICLIVPALLLIFRPEWYTTLIWLSAAIYLVGRALFIVKGFRIFFINFRSLLYFILYLCTLEIIPLLGVCAVNEYLRTYNL